MANVKASNNSKMQYSTQYISIRKEVEKWPAWKVTAYNTGVATSVHAKKIEVKQQVNHKQKRPLNRVTRISTKSHKFFCNTLSVIKQTHIDKTHFCTNFYFFVFFYQPAV